MRALAACPLGARLLPLVAGWELTPQDRSHVVAARFAREYVDWPRHPRHGGGRNRPGILDPGGLPAGWVPVTQVASDHRRWLVYTGYGWAVASVSLPGSGSIASAPRNGNAPVADYKLLAYPHLGAVLDYLRERDMGADADVLLEHAIDWLPPGAHPEEVFLYALSGGEDQSIASLIVRPSVAVLAKRNRFRARGSPLGDSAPVD